MLVTLGVALLVVWAIGVAGPLDVGQLVHGLLLVGLLLLLIAFSKARDAAVGRTRVARTADDGKRREPTR
jgi:hypothetical protein